LNLKLLVVHSQRAEIHGGLWFTYTATYMYKKNIQITNNYIQTTYKTTTRIGLVRVGGVIEGVTS